MQEAKILHPAVDWSKSLSSFRKVWKGRKDKPSQFSDLRVRKHAPISKCGFCKWSMDQLLQAQNETDLLDIRRKRSEHFQEVRLDRDMYAKNVEKATLHWMDYASVAIDGMDQAKTAVPFANGKRDRDQQFPTTQARVICVLIHGVGSSFYVAPADVPHTVDTTITCLMDSFRFLKKRPDGQLAPRLFIQMDNTNSDNKTHVFFAWAASLVQCNLFRQVEINFLAAGHTHADVDQKFSKISQYLGKNPVHTFPELARACRRALLDDSIHSVVLKRDWIVNFKRFYEAEGRFNKSIFHGSRDIHSFKFDITCLDEFGHVRLQSKEWMRMEFWIPSTENISLALPRRFHVVPAVSLFSLPELDKVISGLANYLNIDQGDLLDENFDSDTSDAEEWAEGQGKRHGWRRQPTENTLRHWRKLRAKESRAQSEDCQTCLQRSSAHRDVVISKKLSDEENKANRAKKQDAMRALQDHLLQVDGICTRNALLEPETVGEDSWVFYQQLFGINDDDPHAVVRSRQNMFLVLEKLM